MRRGRHHEKTLLAMFLLTAWSLLGMSAGAAGAAAETTLDIEVDARDLPRRLLHTTIRFTCEPGRLALWYPKWIPGTHAPSGPLETIGGLRLETPAGTAIPWRRDPVELYRVTCEVPSGTREVVARLDTICNTAAVAAAGYLSYGNASLGIINWPTCLLYPEGPTARETKVRLGLRLPARWRFATALKSADSKDGLVTFAPISLETLADTPLIAGENLRTIPLKSGGTPPAFFHLGSEAASALELPSAVIDLYSRMVREAGAMFGACHYPEFHFLVTCSDDLGLLGLEHLSSSLNGVRERDLIDDANRKGWIANLIPHEYVHSWCGKFRRPVGQCTPDFHTPMKTQLLWVYEGLAEYLGEVLMVRSGLVKLEDYRETLASTIGGLMLRTGRKWRSLEDTAVASHLLRSGSPGWSELRRAQDYYFEGALLWLEADAIIRQKSQGTRSLDDFCKRFLGKNPADTEVVPYDLAEVVGHLKGTAEHDWETFLRDRVERPLEALPLELVGRIGYRLEYTAKPPTRAQAMGRGAAPISARHSLGLALGDDGRIIDMVPGMAGDRAGLAPGMKVMGINGRLFSRQRLQDALADSVARRKIELLLVEGDRFRTVVVEYGDGPKYLELVRDEAKPDVLAEILKPVSN
jgi:predicted metalloprotease with PDZ domain